jgi:ABC-type bacteriocin/lantibiotic exporter with double-glycine peptidase domain
MKYFVLYTLARVGLFAAVFGAIWLVLFSWVAWTYASLLWTVLVAAIISAIASIFVLRNLRERFASEIEARAARMSQRLEAARSAEDED